MSKTNDKFWREGVDEFVPRAKRLAVALNARASVERMQSELMSTSLADLCTDVTALIVAFADLSRAHIEDLEMLGVTEANWRGLLHSFLFDDDYAEGVYALAGFKEFIVSVNGWLPFLKSVTKINADLLSIMFSETRRTELRRELFPKEVWNVAFLPKNSTMNVLGMLARIAVMDKKNFLMELKEFVGYEFYERLKVTRMRFDLLPIHCAFDICTCGKLKPPTADLLMSLLPDDKNGLDLSILHHTLSIRWTLLEFAHAAIVEEFQEDAHRVATEVLRRVRDMQNSDNVL